LHPDGVYDVDEACLRRKAPNPAQPLLMAALMMGLMGN
jgi:hypothetical protein